MIATLRPLSHELQALGTTSLFIYGSRARGDAHHLSDLDVYVDYDPSSRFSLVTLAHIKHLIEDATGLDVDITTLNSIPEPSRVEIATDAIQVF